MAIAHIDIDLSAWLKPAMGGFDQFEANLALLIDDRTADQEAADAQLAKEIDSSK